MARFLILSALVAASCSTFAQTSQTPMQTGPMAIKVPPNSTVTMEADVRDADVIGLLKGILGDTTMAAANVQVGNGKAKAGVKTTFNIANHSISVDFGDLSKILHDIHRVHVVGFTAPDKTDATAFYESGFQSMGMHRVFYSNNDNPILVMSGTPPAGMAIVTQNDNDVYVVRTDGLLDMNLLGRYVNQALMTFAASQGTTSAPVAPAKAAVAKPAAVKTHVKRHKRNPQAKKPIAQTTPKHS